MSADRRSASPAPSARSPRSGSSSSACGLDTGDSATLGDSPHRCSLCGALAGGDTVATVGDISRRSRRMSPRCRQLVASVASACKPCRCLCVANVAVVAVVAVVASEKPGERVATRQQVGEQRIKRLHRLPLRRAAARRRASLRGRSARMPPAGRARRRGCRGRRGSGAAPSAICPSLSPSATAADQPFVQPQSVRGAGVGRALLDHQPPTFEGMQRQRECAARVVGCDRGTAVKGGQHTGYAA